MTGEERLPALYAEMDRIAAEAREWAEVEASDSTALVHVGSADPEVLRNQMIAVRREAREKSKELRTAAEAVKAEVEAIMNAQRAEMERRMNEALAELAPLKEQVKRMEEGIWTVNLYLGTSEEIVTLRTGKPTSIDVPIHLRTAVLAMDEEVASFPVQDGDTDWQGMDFRDIEMFDKWLLDNPEHLQQVLPEERGIVTFQPRRTAKVYHEDPLINASINKDNFESYWLIRNGENLYRLKADFLVGGNLMPLTAEFTALFQTTRYNYDTGKNEVVEILPGTREWEKAEKGQDAKRRHYMRVALIIQGLIDRTEMFHPLHSAVNVMNQRTYDDGLVVVIDDSTNLIGTGREPYFDWIRRMNADLRPGMRIIGTFRGSEWDEYEFKGDRWSVAEGNTRLHPNGASRPPRDTLLTIEDRRKFSGQQGLVVRYPRGTVYDPKLWVESSNRPGYGHYGGERPSRQRASAVLLPTDKTIIPFDLVTEAEMQGYLDARTERHAYASMFPLLQAAIAAKRTEREAEAPFRDLLLRVLVDDSGREPEQVVADLDDLVHRFKVGRKWHRPLVSLSQEDEAKALRLIRAEYKRIVASGASVDRDAAAVEAFQRHDPTVMYVGRLSSGKYVAFAPIERQYPETAAHPSLWVREYATTKTARTVVTKPGWVAPGARTGRMTTLFETEQWTGWDRIAIPADDLIDDELTVLLAEVKTRAASRVGVGGQVLAVEYDRTSKYRDNRRLTVHGVKADAGRERLELRYTWTRREDGTIKIVGEPEEREETFQFSYGGNNGRRAGRDAYTRDVFMPWQEPNEPRRSTFEDGGLTRVNKASVLWAVGVDVIADLTKRARDAKSQEDRASNYYADVVELLHTLHDQQIAEQVAAIKADFLKEYPDEEMWEEKRETLTKGVKPLVDLTVWSSRNRWHGDPEFLDDVMVRVGLPMHQQWGGLTVADVYRLADEPIPTKYEPVAHLVFPTPEKPVDDDGDDE